jgi:hypothetical protein
MKLDEDGDEILSVTTCTEDDDVVLTTARGQCIRFPVTDVRVFAGRNSVGVRGGRLECRWHLTGLQKRLDGIGGDIGEYAARVIDEGLASPLERGGHTAGPQPGNHQFTWLQQRHASSTLITIGWPVWATLPAVALEMRCLPIGASIFHLVQNGNFRFT